jgi:formate dehydrogenase (NADP+) beta subunit
MRTNIPAFRLPPPVLDEEIDYIVDMGVEVRYNAPVDSLKALLAQGFDAVFVGSGAPKGKELDLPGRHDTRTRAHRHRLAGGGALRPRDRHRRSGC